MQEKPAVKNWIDGIFLIILCLVLLYSGKKIIKDQEWPCDLDNYRDIAQVQTILDGHYGQDPYYLNEHVWYTPGCHFIIAGICLLLGKPAPLVIGKIGAYLNLLVPLVFYLMLRIIWGRVTALLGTAAYLIFQNSYPVWVSALYTPWFYTHIFAQAAFYIAVILLYEIITQNPGLKYYIILGILLGIISLLHLGPTFLAGSMIFLFFLDKLYALWQDRKSNYREITALFHKFMGVAIPALLISQVFYSFPIWYYRLKIKNFHPTGWQWDGFTLEQLPGFLLKEVTGISSIIAIFGFVYLLRKHKDSTVKKISLFWLITGIGFLADDLLKIWLKTKGIQLPLLLPPHHFFLYLKSLSYIFFGYGVGIIATELFKVLKGVKRKLWETPVHQPVSRKMTPRAFLEGGCFLLFLALLAVYLLAVYPQNPGILELKSAAQQRYEKPELIAAYRWVRQNTGKNDVFLCADSFSMIVAAPAGRKVVATHPFFSNPYVDLNERKRDRNIMYKCFTSGDTANFVRLCKKYHVKYLVTTPDDFEKGHQSVRPLAKTVFVRMQLLIAKIIMNPGSN